MPRVVVALVAFALGGALAPLAGAADSVTIGGLDPTPNDSQAQCGYEPVIYVEGANGLEKGSPAYPPTTSKYIVPAGTWKITSWSVSQHAFSDQIRLAVVSFGSGATALTVDAFSPLESISAAQQGQVVTFSSDIPVRGGEEIALDGYGGPLQGCTYPGDRANQVDIADDGQEGTHDFGQNAYVQAAQVNLEATLQPVSSTTSTSGSTPSTSTSTTTSSSARHGAGDARLKAAILAADDLILHSPALRALKRKHPLHSRAERGRTIRALQRLRSTMRAAMSRVKKTPAVSFAGRAWKRDWMAAMRLLTRGLRELAVALRHAGDGHGPRAKAELLLALRSVARAERRELKARVELGLPRSN